MNRAMVVDRNLGNGLLTNAPREALRDVYNNFSFAQLPEESTECYQIAVSVNAPECLDRATVDESDYLESFNPVLNRVKKVLSACDHGGEVPVLQEVRRDASSIVFVFGLPSAAKGVSANNWLGQLACRFRRRRHAAAPETQSI